MSNPLFPYVRRVVIENFRSIRRLDVELPKFGVLVGPNGSGKTNFVMAIALLGELLRRGSTEPLEELGWDELVRRTKKRAHHMRLGVTIVLPILETETLQRVDFGGTPLEVALEIDMKPGISGSVQISSERLRMRVGADGVDVTLAGGEVKAKLTGTPRVFDLWFPEQWRRIASMATKLGPTTPLDNTDSIERFLRDLFTSRNHRDDPEQRYFRLLTRQPIFSSELLRSATSVCVVSRMRLDATALRSDTPTRGPIGDAGQGLAAAIAAVRGLKEQPKREFLPVLHALQEVFPSVEDVVPTRTGPGRLALNFRERGVTDPFGQGSVSDGVLHALALLLSLVGPSRHTPLYHAGLLAIEEPENAIHPWSIAVMMDRMQTAHRRQLLLTTHSVEVVNQVRDPASLLICELGADGTRISPSLHKQQALNAILKQSGQRLGEIWQSGELGGVPGDVT